ncbi:MAG: PQQ-dependent sugar dehydrogenase [Ignavibacteria bacterium]|nr:PQQ-dependent sugar dehydrogenase [Ignavibacteria bacterium]MBK6417782.1 PQQ-dependent sugar dehydrogenase [Ignavibacteria bacterium]MBK7031814.1 PQQ-dependent sugar dehydrogenase [Ignavibacteria bacterium]MBK7411288.1 PQQ-dependent sugar dehydrogenase [Ignavibacteria bacterium]
MARPILILISLICVAVSSYAQRTITLPKGTELNLRLLADNVGYPASMTQGNDGYLWLTDRVSGNVLRVHPITGVTTTVLTVDISVSPSDPNVRGGLYGIALHPSFTTGTPIVFVTSTRVGDTLVVERYRFDGEKLIEPRRIFATGGVPLSQGLTLETLADNTLLVSVGSYDNLDPNKMENVNGKVIRMTFEGEAVPSNPHFSETFPKSAGSYIYTSGHRNPLGLVQVPPTSSVNAGVIYSTEMGPLSFDEVNRLEAGSNYGWLNIAGYCTSAPQGMKCPLATMNQAPSGMAYYGSNAIPDWTNSLLIGTLRGRGLVVANLNEGGLVTNIDATRPSDDVMTLDEGQLIDLSLEGETERIMDVTVAQDGRVYAALYESGDAKRGRIVVLENPAVHNPTSVEGSDLAVSAGFSYGPNPARNELRIRLDEASPSQWTVSVVDIKGRTMYSVEVASSATEVLIPTASLASGVYMLVIKNESSTKTATFSR